MRGNGADGKARGLGRCWGGHGPGEVLGWAPAGLSPRLRQPRHSRYAWFPAHSTWIQMVPRGIEDSMPSAPQGLSARWPAAGPVPEEPQRARANPTHAVCPAASEAVVGHEG